MTKVRLLELDDRGRQFLAGEIAAISPLLASAPSVRDLTPGIVVATVPESTPADPYSFDRAIFPIALTKPFARVDASGSTLIPVPTAVGALVHWLFEFLQRNPSYLLIGESFFLIPADLRRTNPMNWLPKRTHTFNERVYHLATSTDSFDDVLEVVDATLSGVPSGIAWVVERGESALSEAAELRAEEIHAWLEAICVIAHGAYDGEGAVMWVRAAHRNAVLQRTFDVEPLAQRP